MLSVFTALPLRGDDTPEGLAEASGLSHPRFFFTVDRLPSLREQVQQGLSSDFMRAVRSSASKYQSIATTPYQDDGPYTGRNLLAYVGNLAFTGWIDVDMARIRKAKEILLAAVRTYSVNEHKAWNGHLATGDACFGLAVGYDWLAPFMTESERREVVAELEEYGAYLLQDSLMKPTRGPMSPFGAMNPSRLMHNHGAVSHSALYMAGIIAGKQNWADHAALRVRGYAFYFQDGTGAPLEGIGYADYGLESIALANEVSRSTNDKDLLRGVRGLREHPRFILHHTVPWGGRVVPQNQTDPEFNSLAGSYYLINRVRDRLGLHAWRKLVLERDGSYQLPEIIHTSHTRMLPFLVLWTDPSLEPSTPDETQESPFAHFYQGMTAARGSWSDPDAALVTFQCVRRTLGGWDHSDENSFTFSAFANNFFVDPAHSFLNGEHHSVVMIDGQSQRPGGGGRFVEGLPLAAENRGRSYFMEGDAADAYRNDPIRQDVGLPVETAKRRLLFVPDQASPFLIIEDRVALDDESVHQFSWRGIYADRFNANRLELDAEGASAVIHASENNAVARVTFLEPSGVRLSGTKLRAPGKGYTIDCLDAASPLAKEGYFLTVVVAARTPNDLPSIEHVTEANGRRIIISTNEEGMHTVSVTETAMRLMISR